MGSGKWGRVGVPQGSISGPAFFNLFINVLDSGLEALLSNLADGTKLGGAVGTLEGREARRGVRANWRTGQSPTA